jgi:hypothetical protein
MSDVSMVLMFAAGYVMMGSALLGLMLGRANLASRVRVGARFKP